MACKSLNDLVLVLVCTSFFVNISLIHFFLFLLHWLSFDFLNSHTNASRLPIWSSSLSSSVTCHVGGGWILACSYGFLLTVSQSQPLNYHWNTGSLFDSFHRFTSESTSIHVLLLSLMGLTGTYLVKLSMADFTQTEKQTRCRGETHDFQRAHKTHCSELTQTPPSENLTVLILECTPPAPHNRAKTLTWNWGGHLSQPSWYLQHLTGLQGLLSFRISLNDRHSFHLIAWEGHGSENGYW